jgi:SAM-dependent MidA family methyltransferase
MNGYSVTIKETSKNLTAKERIAIKDTTSAIKLDEATQVESVLIAPEMFAVLSIHNDKSDNPDYENYIVVDKDGRKFVTGSQSFWTSFMDIWTEMENEDEDWSVLVYRHPSKNYKGKDFITCAIQ